MRHKCAAVIAAHPDDEVLGCGGTIARLSDGGFDVHVLLLADGESSRGDSASAFGEQIGQRGQSAQRAADILGVSSIRVEQLTDNQMDAIPRLSIVKMVESFVAVVDPGVVLTHHAGDVNIDHRVLHDAVIAACRPQPGTRVDELWFFEVPSSTEWRPAGGGRDFRPTCFVDISTTLQRKLAALDAYASEMRPFPHPRSIEAVEALARWRGATIGVNAAEAFMVGRRVVRSGEFQL